MRIRHTRAFVGSLAGVAVLLLLFLGAGWVAQHYADYLARALGDVWWGPLLYLALTVVAVVIAPVSTLPLLPVASTLWGVVAAALLTIVGYVVGAQVAFHLARTYGERLVGRLVALDKVRSFEQRIPRERIFWSVVLLRMLVPVDALSYALGLFSTMSARSYLLATAVGVTPFAFVFAYAGTLPWRAQVLMAAAVLALVLLGFLVRHACRRHRGGA